MKRFCLSAFRVLFLLSFVALIAGIAVTFKEIRVVSLPNDKREGMVAMIKIIFLGGTLVFASWMAYKYLERKQ